MALGPIEMNGIISRTQDITPIKRNQDIKPMVDQNNYQNEFNKEINHNLKQVHEANDSDKNEDIYDAREEGKNKYYNPKQKNKKKNGKDSDKVTMKSQSHLDIKI